MKPTQLMLLLEVSNIVSDVLEMLLLVRAGNHIIGSVALVGSDEIRVVDGGHRCDWLQKWTQLILKFGFENLDVFSKILKKKN